MHGVREGRNFFLVVGGEGVMVIMKLGGSLNGIIKCPPG